MVPAIEYTEQGLKKYFYRIETYMATFSPGETTQEFLDIQDRDLKVARRLAFNKYEEIKKMLIKRGKYILPFASREDFVTGKNACFSIWISLVEELAGEEEEYIIHGEPREEMRDALAYERRVFDSLTILI